MAAAATYKHGDPLMVDYVPSVATPAGSVIVLSATAGICCMVTHTDIAANVLGAASIGGGFYDGVNFNNAVNGTKVYWDAANSRFTTTATSNALFGFVAEGGGGGVSSTCTVFHWPLI